MLPSNHLPWLWRAASSWRDSFSGPLPPLKLLLPARQNRKTGRTWVSCPCRDQVEKATLEDGDRPHRLGDFQDLVEGGLGVMFNGQLSLCRSSAAQLNLLSLHSSIVRGLATVLVSSCSSVYWSLGLPAPSLFSLWGHFDELSLPALVSYLLLSQLCLRFAIIFPDHQGSPVFETTTSARTSGAQPGSCRGACRPGIPQRLRSLPRGTHALWAGPVSPVSWVVFVLQKNFL